MKELNLTVIDYVMSLGACAAGIVTVGNLEGGPPSADLRYILPSAQSAVVFALPLDQTMIMPFTQDAIKHGKELDKNR
jgi:epoxyqueuosine reductase